MYRKHFSQVVSQDNIVVNKCIFLRVGQRQRVSIITYCPLNHNILKINSPTIVLVKSGENMKTAETVLNSQQLK